MKKYNEMVDRLIENKKKAVYPESSFPIIDEWRRNIESLKDDRMLKKFGELLKMDQRLGEKLNRVEPGLAEYMAEAIRFHFLTATLRRLRQI